MSEIPEEIRKMFPDQPIHKMDIVDGELIILASSEPLNEPDFEKMPIEQVNRYLRDHGYDPEQVGIRGKILAEALIRESQGNRFVWWILNVYARNVQDLLSSINKDVFVHSDLLWSLVHNLRDYTEKIYDGTYLDVDISTVVKTSTDNNKLDTASLEYAAKWIENSLVGETNERVVEFGKNMAMSIRAAKSLEEDENCPECNGSGEVAGDYFSDDGMGTCPRCGGSGTR